MIDSFTSFKVVIACSMAFAFPIAIVEGSWIMRSAVGLICTLSPAIAMTEAADAAMLAIFTVTADL